MNNLPIPTQNTQVGPTDLQSFEFSQRVAKMLTTSSLVPEIYQNNLGNCVIALNMACRMSLDPLMVMQNMYIVYGKPSWSSSFLIGLFNSKSNNSGFSSMRFQFTGNKKDDSYGCIAWATDLKTGEKVEGTEITIAMAKAEGWYGKKGSKWVTMPQQMLSYRAAAFFMRVYTPELSLGLHTVEENLDIIEGEIVSSTPINRATGSSSAASVNAILEQPAEPKPEPEPKPEWPKKTPEGWTDSTGALYEELKHAWNGHTRRPKVNPNGSFQPKPPAPAHIQSEEMFA